MFRRVALVLLVLLLSPLPASATNHCEFKLGFKVLHDLIPDLVGVCLSHELHDPANGNTIQTTRRPNGATGMLVWRKADNWTAFTDGATTWINGPEGLASRPNAGPLFPWEASPVAAAPPPPPAPAIAPPPAPAPAPPPPPSAPASQTLSGRGQRVSDRFSLEAGLSIFKMQHNGQRNFIVRLLNESGQNVELFANEIGDYNGTQAVGITSAGQHVFQVDADGSWSITVEQPRPGSAPGIPISFNGRGASVTGFFDLPSGLKTIQMRHSGRRNFIVRLLDRNGRSADLAANVIGGFDGSKATNLAGIHLLNIDADGDWSIEIR